MPCLPSTSHHRITIFKKYYRCYVYHSQMGGKYGIVLTTLVPLLLTIRINQDLQIIYCFTHFGPIRGWPLASQCTAQAWARLWPSFSSSWITICSKAPGTSGCDQSAVLVGGSAKMWLCPMSSRIQTTASSHPSLVRFMSLIDRLRGVAQTIDGHSR